MNQYKPSGILKGIATINGFVAIFHFLNGRDIEAMIILIVCMILWIGEKVNFIYNHLRNE